MASINPYDPEKLGFGSLKEGPAARLVALRVAIIGVLVALFVGGGAVLLVNNSVEQSANPVVQITVTVAGTPTVI